MKVRLLTLAVAAAAVSLYHAPELRAQTDSITSKPENVMGQPGSIIGKGSYTLAPTTRFSDIVVEYGNYVNQTFVPFTPPLTSPTAINQTAKTFVALYQYNGAKNTTYSVKATLYIFNNMGQRVSSGKVAYGLVTTPP